MSVSVAIAIPAFNASATIGQTLEALQANDALRRVGLTVVLDDCSADGTGDAARRHWRSSTPLEVWRNESNKGERRTTNSAIARLAEAFEWTFILHADDLVKPCWLSLYFAELEKAPEGIASICSSYDNWWPASGRVKPGDDFPHRPAQHIEGGVAAVRDTIDKGCWWHLSGSGLRNRVVLDIGGFDPEMPQHGDWEWLLRCLAGGYGVLYVPRTTMLYRQHTGSVSSMSFREARDLRERVGLMRRMRRLGYLNDREFDRRIRQSMRLVARRTLVRIARVDRAGFERHAALLVEIARDYLRGRRSEGA